MSANPSRLAEVQRRARLACAASLFALSVEACGARSSLEAETGGGGGDRQMGGRTSTGGGNEGGSANTDAGGRGGAAGSTNHACPTGTFSTERNAPSCTPWKDCAPGSRVSVDGTATSNRKCAPCPDGQTTTATNSLACQPVAVTELSAGYYHTCALRTDHSIKCWGLNTYGQLGYGNTENIGDDELPSSVGTVSVTATPGVTVTEVAGGIFHTCALLSDGSVKCWGLATYGQLGYGNGTRIGDDELPSSIGPVSVTVTPGVTVKKLAAGFEHTCALLSDGTVKCWGANYQAGQLGYGITEQFIGDDELPSSVGVVSVTTTPGLTVTALAAGAYHTCALLSDGSVTCWGQNKDGELGYGNTENIGDNELPSSVGAIRITTTRGVTVKQLVAGSFHTCALLSDGSVKCWGLNDEGQLGYGNTKNIGDDDLPSSVGAVALASTPAVTAIQLTAGGGHTCALLSDGTVKCWGYDHEGQLGYGKTDTIGDDELPSSSGPVSVTTTPTSIVVGVTAGGEHTCVRLADGTVKCWGASYDGQLGYGNTKTIGDDEPPSSVGPVVLF